MRKLSRIVAMLSGMVVIPALAAEPPSKITVGYLNLVNAQLVTKNLGLLAKEMPGVEIGYVKIGGGGDMLRAITANQVDFGGLGNPPAAIGLVRDLPMKGIMVLNMLDYVEAMVVRTEKNIKTIKDLAGKKVAAPFGSTTHYLLLKALAEEGVKPGDLELLDLAPADIAIAWSRGDIDAAWFWEPNLDKAVKDGGNILITSGEMAKRGYPTWDVAVVMNEFAEKHPEYVEKFVRAECAGIDFWLKNPEKTAEIIAQELSLPIEDATRMMKGTEMVPCPTQLTEAYMGKSGSIGQFADTLESTAQFLVAEKRLPKAPTRDEFAAKLDMSYLEKIVGE